jgi:hypothetical protein
VTLSRTTLDAHAAEARAINALPRRGEVAEASKREPDDEVMWSVTTLIGILDKPALVPWAVGVTAERVVRKLAIIQQRINSEGDASAVDYIKGLRWQTDGLLADNQLGTVAHGLFDEYALSGTRPDVTPDLHPDHAAKGSTLVAEDMRSLHGMLHQFELFLEQYQPAYDACEAIVYSPTYTYAGQADAFVHIDRMALILDYKTSRKTYDGRGKIRTPYPEVGLQLAAYRYAEMAAVWRARRYENRSRRYYLLSSAEKALAVRVPPVDGGVAVRITPDHFGVYPVRCGERQHDAFLYCLEVARWQFNESAHVVGNPMVPPVPATDLADPFAGLPTH